MGLPVLERGGRQWGLRAWKVASETILCKVERVRLGPSKSRRGLPTEGPSLPGSHLGSQLVTPHHLARVSRISSSNPGPQPRSSPTSHFLGAPLVLGTLAANSHTPVPPHRRSPLPRVLERPPTSPTPVPAPLRTHPTKPWCPQCPRICFPPHSLSASSYKPKQTPRRDAPSDSAPRCPCRGARAHL